jgi:hypothetical protein
MLKNSVFWDITLYKSLETQQTFLRNVGWISADYTAIYSIHNYRFENLRSYESGGYLNPSFTCLCSIRQGNLKRIHS